MGWTEAQQRAIDERDSNILVSAAAGSGKTAVLVERIINKMTDEENPKDIDEFLVVTFTKAAAAQMREKIAIRIEKMLEKEPDNEHLMKQAVLVNRADITTIDSFCLRIVKENFGLLNIDSNFNIGDNGIMELMKNDVLDALFDKLYDEKNEDFIMLLECFGCDRNDEALKENILKIYNVAKGFSRPYVWLEEAEKALMIKDKSDLMNSKWMKDFREIVKSYVKTVLDYINDGKFVCEMPGGPDKYFGVSESDEEAILKILEAEDFDALKTALNISWKRLPACKGDSYDEELKEKYQTIRKRYKAMIDKIKIKSGDSDSILAEIINVASYLVPLIHLVTEFSNEYEAEKSKKKLLEFSDVEHLAYKLVCAGYDENGSVLPTEAAKRISEKYDEIFIDEYQDSNYLQEEILNSVSGINSGRNNMFMVGDVKQSIYKFRMARPDLFLSKYKTYKDNGPEIKIELSNNFRSRANVLKSVNYFFYQLMSEDLGGIDYNEKTELVPTKEFPEPDPSISGFVDETTEIILADNFETEERLSGSEIEAYVIAKRIKELVEGDNPQYVYDEDKDIYRKASYKDIVVLARSVKGFGEIIYNILTKSGIPAYVDDNGGYFEAVEIKTIMSLLSVVDNIRQDIPLAAVLISPMAGLDENDLSVICDYASKKLKQRCLLYDKCLYYIDNNDDGISEKLKRIFDIVYILRADNKNMSISSLIWKALDLTNYYNYAISMPLGERRKNNINMLLEKAYIFEEGTYKGLFNFLRYIDKMKLNEMDFGEASLFSDDEDVVRIMTMHKSKGLEFPIVFVSGLGKGINYREYNNQLLISSDYYLSANYIDRKNRYKNKTLMKEVVKLLMKSEMTAEELRILYVAFTRAKEKLIITAQGDKIEEMSEKIFVSDNSDMALPIDIRADSSKYITWILACMKRYESLKPDCDIKILTVHEEDLYGYLGKEEVKKNLSVDEFYENALSDYNQELYDKYKTLFKFEYPFKKYVNIKNKMSISEIKKMKAFDGEEYDSSDTAEELIDELIDEESKTESEINKNKEGLSGAQRGTIIHKFMELLDFKETLGLNKEELLIFIREFSESLKEKEIFSEEEAKVVNPYKIRNMLLSDLGRRMSEADSKGKLKKEQQFSAGIPADMIYDFEASDNKGAIKGLNDYSSEKTDEETVIVQGIMDAFFYEDDKVVLMDYKTDYANEDELIKRYNAQLDYYAYVLEKITGLKVSEKLIYSFCLEKQIKID